ncbi:MAG: hypothetical protein H6581_09455 [Bacteroidia bacterium]|nr:hypothetical protein [Bacteroidia bacterium]
MNHRPILLCLILSLVLLSPGLARTAPFQLDHWSMVRQTHTNQEYLQEFPFTEFTPQYFNSAHELVAAREYLVQNGRDSIADPILRQATNVYLQMFPCNPSDFGSYAEKVTLGEDLFKICQQQDLAGRETFEGIADRLLKNVSYEYEQLLKVNPKAFSKDQQRELADRLGALAYPVTPPPPSDLEKLIIYIGQGQWHHIWETIYGRYLSDPFILISVVLNLLLGSWFTAQILSKFRKYATIQKTKS